MPNRRRLQRTQRWRSQYLSYGDSERNCTSSEIRLSESAIDTKYCNFHVNLVKAMSRKIYYHLLSFLPRLQTDSKTYQEGKVLSFDEYWQLSARKRSKYFNWCKKNGIHCPRSSENPNRK